VAVQLPLPEPEGLPAEVLFHREHPADPVLLLQVPNPGATDAETYVVRLDKPEHRTWMDGLKRARWLKDLLQMEMHVLYEPGTGYMEALRDLETPPPFADDLGDARRQAAQNDQFARHFMHRRHRRPAISRFRAALMGKPLGRGPQQGRLMR